MQVLQLAWASLAWLARATVLPARFFYLLFLERPFAAAISLFLWVLPLLAFAIAVTLAGIVIGGSVGWTSAVLIGLFQAPADGDEARRGRRIQSTHAGEETAAAADWPDGAGLTRRRRQKQQQR